MKKSNMIVGLLYVLAGMGLLAGALWTKNQRLGSLLFGMAGAMTAGGVGMLARYGYWSRPANRQRYQQRLEQESIQQRDELKTMVRDRAGRYAYLLGLAAVSLAMLLFSVLDALNLIQWGRPAVLALAGYLLFQILAGYGFFHWLLNQYI